MDNSGSSTRPGTGAGTGTGSVVGQTGTGPAPTGTSLGAGTGAGTAIVLTPALARNEPPELEQLRGWRLSQVLLVTTVFLVVVIVTLLAGLSAVATRREFEATKEESAGRVRDQALEIGQTLAHTLSLTGASSLRDNNYSFLGEVVTSIAKDNKNVLQVQIFDAERLLVADTDPSAKLGTPSDISPGRASKGATYQGHPVLEYHEPIDYGSSVGPGVVVVGYSLAPLQTQLAELQRAEDAAVRRNTLQTGGLGLIFMTIAAVIAAVQSRRITRPLDGLTSKVMQLAQGDLQTRVEDAGRGSREVQTLGVVFNHMADRINWLLEDVRNKAALEREMDLARRVQETLLPTKDPLQVGAVRIAGTCLTADACGGDWWLRAALDPNRVVIGVGDVTGHGLSTALVAASASSAFAAAMMMQHADQIDATNLITALNQILFHLGRGEYQMSSSVAVIDIERGEIDYAAGAHPSACLYNRKDGKLSSLPARGALLGASNTSRYESRHAKLRAGDVVVWYTDGFTECRGAQDKLYGFQRLSAMVQQLGHLPAERLRDALIADAREFSGNAKQQDDITVVIAEYTPIGPRS